MFSGSGSCAYTNNTKLKTGLQSWRLDRRAASFFRYPLRTSKDESWTPMMSRHPTSRGIEKIHLCQQRQGRLPLQDLLLVNLHCAELQQSFASTEPDMRSIDQLSVGVRIGTVKEQRNDGRCHRRRRTGLGNGKAEVRQQLDAEHARLALLSHLVFWSPFFVIGPNLLVTLAQKTSLC